MSFSSSQPAYWQQNNLTYTNSLLPANYIFRWIAVRQRFNQFHDNICLTPNQIEDGVTKYKNITNLLNKNYYSDSDPTRNSFFVGSWGKNTAIRPPRDIDLCFIMPTGIYWKFDKRIGNIQSALLQEVKNVLYRSFPNTEIKGDGQVVVVGFESYKVEVVPVFELDNGQFYICDTNNGGVYKTIDPIAEVNHLKSIHERVNYNLLPLIRMLKTWQYTCSVPIKSFFLELLATEFIINSPWKIYDWFFFDWIMRDFFVFLYSKANHYVCVPGTRENIDISNEWQSKAESAYYRSLKACDYEYNNDVLAAGQEWQKIFGNDIPLNPKL